MSIQTSTTGDIIINGKWTGLKVTQRASGTVVCTPEVPLTGQKYKEHPMPYQRYSLAHNEPRKPGQNYDPKICAGASQFEADVIELLKSL